MGSFLMYANLGISPQDYLAPNPDSSEYSNNEYWSAGCDEFPINDWPPGDAYPLAQAHTMESLPNLYNAGITIPNYGQDSSHSSDRSLSGSVPSSTTSYNEHDLGPLFSGITSPQSPTSIRNISPECLHTDMNRSNSLEKIVPFDKSIPLEKPLGGTSSELHICPECPNIRKPFGRSAELRRHINRQHRCPHEDCKQAKFSNKKERDDHQMSVHQNCLGWRCGTCLQRDLSQNALAREEKLRDHFRQIHGSKSPLTLIQCTLGSCLVSKVFGGVFFPSENELLQHQRQMHGNITNATDYLACKRPSSSATSDAKRWRSEAPSDIIAPPCSDHVSHQEKTVPLSMIELRALTKLDDWDTFLGRLQSLDIAATFDNKITAIKLRSKLISNLQTGYEELAEMIREIRKTQVNTDFHARDEFISHSHKKDHLYQTLSVQPQPEIGCLSLDQDAELIALWNDHLLDVLPKIVRKAKIDGDYSVSFVRQKIQGDWHPTIRFRSSENQGTLSREIFRDSVDQICADHMLDPLLILFSQGSLVRLARGSVNVATLDDPPLDHRFPHERRYYPQLGMGVSCGIAGCPHASATAGGFVKVEGKMYMLTVGHLLDACPCIKSIDVQSPSEADAANVRDLSKRMILDIELESQQAPTGEIPLGKVAEHFFPTGIDEKIEQYTRIQAESELRSDKYAFGTIRQRSSHGQDPHRSSINPSSQQRIHKMDWSLIEVTAKNRKGKNIHRYGRTANPSIEDLRMELIKPEGTGTVCTTTGYVNGGESVHYVGTTSGLRDGVVNPAPELYEDRRTETVSYEWGMIVPNCQNLRDSAFKGDSGAWIISDNNKLLGQLWGWDDGKLLFTPIVDIFADIASKMSKNSDVVTLPQEQDPKVDYQEKLLCRISTELESIHIHEDTRHHNPTLLSPVTIPTVGRTTRASSWCSIGSIPSLMSSMSTASGGDVATPDEMIPRLNKRSTDPVSHKIPVEEWVNVDAIEQRLSAFGDNSRTLQSV